MIGNRDRPRPTALAIAEVLRRQHRLGLSQTAAGIAFWLLIAAFPAGLAVVNVAGLVVSQETVARLVGRFLAATPGSLGDLVAEQLQAVAAPTPGSLAADAVLVVVALWTVSTAVQHLIRAHGATEPGAVGRRLLALAVAVAGIVALGLTALVIDAATPAGSVAGYLLSGVVVAGLVAAAYRAALGPPYRMRHELPGAVLAAVGFLVVALGLGVDAAVAENMRLIYGAVAGFVVSMLAMWRWVGALLVGAVVNDVWQQQDTAPAPPTAGPG